MTGPATISRRDWRVFDILILGCGVLGMVLMGAYAELCDRI
jgi:hypothetical protein